ncbi:MAG: phosphotransferase family protein [bacterium]|nr:phosphotransferase family protein [bacterium]
MTDSVLIASDFSGDLPAAVTAWLETTLAGKITRKERFVSRREGWLVDLDCADKRSLHGFLRLERFANGEMKQPACQVRRETAVTAALHARGIPVPAVYAHSEELQATLFERVPGRDNIHELEDAHQQSEIAKDFMRHLAWLHSLSVRDLDLPELPLPVSAEEYALAGIDELEQTYASSVAVPDPLALLTFHWLRRNIPAPPTRPVLVQGDTGPGNFVYVGDQVSAILDWECAHFGDPMEDLGHLYSRAFFHPWGEMTGLIEAYTACASQSLDKEKLHFYRVASFAKAALGSTVAVNHFGVEGPLPMMIFFSIAGERGLAQSLADALHVEVGRAALPEPEQGVPRSLRLPTEEISDHIVDNELLPELRTSYLRDRATQLRELARYQARREQHLSAVVAQELEELRVFSKGPVSTIQDGLEQLNARIEAWDEASIGDIARYLSRRAQRAEALALPLAGRYSNLVLSPI